MPCWQLRTGGGLYRLGLYAMLVAKDKSMYFGACLFVVSYEQLGTYSTLGLCGYINKGLVK